MSGFTYRLYLENGEDSGNFETAVPNWSIGMEFFSGDHTRFRIVNIVAQLDDGEFNGLFCCHPGRTGGAVIKQSRIGAAVRAGE